MSDAASWVLRHKLSAVAAAVFSVSTITLGFAELCEDSARRADPQGYAETIELFEGMSDVAKGGLAGSAALFLVGLKTGGRKKEEEGEPGPQPPAP